jgi:hypothetical protein
MQNYLPEIGSSDRIALESNIRTTTRRLDDETIAAVSETITAAENAVAKDPASFQSVHARQRATIDSLVNIDEASRVRLRGQAYERIATAALLGRAFADPEGTATILRGSMSPSAPTEPVGQPGTAPSPSSPLPRGIRNNNPGNITKSSIAGAGRSPVPMPATRLSRLLRPAFGHWA